MLSRLELRVRSALERYEPWTNVYGFARSMLALATAGTLAFNPASILFRPGAGTAMPPFCDHVRGMGAFCLATDHLDVSRWLCVAALLIVASGWRPRFTALFHWWITFSLQANALVLDGGDQVAAVLALLLLPVALTDGRAWHWSSGPEQLMRSSAVRKCWAFMGHVLIRFQVAGIYFHAALGKMTVPEWKDGTAMYYWGSHETFGSPPWIDWWLRPILTHGWSVSIFTWSVVLFELLLSLCIAMERRYQRLLLYVAIAFHVGIVFVQGLASFGTTMVAALVLYLRPWSRSLTWIPARVARFSNRDPRSSFEPRGAAFTVGGESLEEVDA